jgi:phosphoglycerate dehydrogenase-like enzyme
LKVYAKSEEVRNELNRRTKDDIIFTDQISEAEIIVSGRLNEEDIHDGIKAMIIPYVGYNQVDIDLLNNHHIALFNTQVNGVFVAERALGLCLSVMGKIALVHDNVKHDLWSTYESPSEWISLRKKRVGLLGYGVIGRAIHEMMKPFDVKAYTINRGKEYHDITLIHTVEERIDQVDVLFVQVPLNDTTEGLLDKKLLERMKNMFLINVGRGKVIDEDALYQVLTDGTLKGFASDVWYQYPKKRTKKRAPSNYPICELNHVVCTSHSAGNIEGIDALTYDDVARRIMAIKNGNYEGNIILRKEDKK